MAPTATRIEPGDAHGHSQLTYGLLHYLRILRGSSPYICYHVSDSGFVVAWIKGYEPCGSIRIRILLILLVILLSVQYGTRYTTCECTILDTPPHEQVRIHTNFLSLYFNLNLK